MVIISIIVLLLALKGLSNCAKTIRAEQKRQAAKIAKHDREIAAHAKAIEKHEKMLLKHEEEIKKLKFSVRKAESDIEHLKEKIGDLYALLDIEENELAACANGSGEQAKHQKKVISFKDQIHAAEQKLAKAKFDRNCAIRKLEVA